MKSILQEHIEQCQKLLELGGNMVIVVYMDEVVSIYTWHVDLKGLIKDKNASKFIQLKGVEIYLWWLQLIMKESLHTMSHLVPTI